MNNTIVNAVANDRLFLKKAAIALSDLKQRKQGDETQRDHSIRWRTRADQNIGLMDRDNWNSRNNNALFAAINRNAIISTAVGLFNAPRIGIENALRASASIIFPNNQAQSLSQQTHIAPAQASSLTKTISATQAFVNFANNYAENIVKSTTPEVALQALNSNPEFLVWRPEVADLQRQFQSEVTNSLHAEALLVDRMRETIIEGQGVKIFTNDGQIAYALYEDQARSLQDKFNQPFFSKLLDKKATLQVFNERSHNCKVGSETQTVYRFDIDAPEPSSPRTHQPAWAVL